MTLAMPLRRSHTAVLEKNSTFTSGFATEPYEAAWAGEAIWFIRVFECDGAQTSLDVKVQISPDGLEWCDQGSELTIQGKGLFSIPISTFGHWLRLETDLMGDAGKVRVQILLALKE